MDESSNLDHLRSQNRCVVFRKHAYFFLGEREQKEPAVSLDNNGMDGDKLLIFSSGLNIWALGGGTAV